MTTVGGRNRPSPVALAAWVAMAAAGTTLAVIVLPFVRFAYRAPTLHIVLETANALIALLVAYLVYGRFRQSRRLQELLLVLGLSTVAIANLAPDGAAIGRHALRRHVQRMGGARNPVPRDGAADRSGSGRQRVPR